MSETASRSVMDVLLSRDLWFTKEEDVSRINSYITQGAFSPYIVLALSLRWRSVYWLLWLAYCLPSAAEGLINRYQKYLVGARYALLRAQSTRSVKITEGDELFFPALHWISNHENLKDKPDVVLKTKYTGSNPQVNYDFVLDKGIYTFTENGVVYVVNYTAVEDGQESFKTLTFSYCLQDESKFGPLLNDFNKRWLAQSIINAMVIEAVFKYNGSMASWGEPHQEISRNLKSVILNKTEKDDLISKLDNFFQPDTQKKYDTIKSPYHFGLLLYGRMGTGKSSLAYALAAHYRMRIYCLSFNEPDLSPGTLLSLLKSIPPNSILLLEEIDQIMIPTSGPGSWKQIKVENVFVALDKRARRGGITIMTTNMRSKLDKRLIRPGRINMQVRFTYANKHQIYGMFMLYCWQTDIKAHSKDKVHAMAIQFKDAVPSHRVTTADIHNYLVNYMADPETALADADKLINNAPAIDLDADREADGDDCPATIKDDDEENLPFEFDSFDELETAHTEPLANINKPEGSLPTVSGPTSRHLQLSQAVSDVSSDLSNDCFQNQAIWYLTG
ncbi:uncharacterized protein PV07_02616 [Cladophialophora immunda]|uniref:AAA+ ATPase domain-containing protein n=1 Tax=Cladophialophora immunda TaxID=569365 RepID=A0A0D2CLI4_9EURO|nr:uncharacterized protein PV07_02616 [Cladophialophora immunda]KIW30925.1 hypothetical protein PV07_02616 [Cladophialophora immunda]